jgi:hypothetical protein
MLAFAVITLTYASSQRTALNSIYAEGLGPGLLYSINYERLVVNDLGVRVGMSYSSFSASSTNMNGTTEGSASVAFMTFPLTASYLGISGGAHCLELGGGMTLISASGKASAPGMESKGSGMAVLENVLIGYRIHPVNGGFQFRVGFSGLFGTGLGFSVTDPTAFGFLPWFYLSLGGCF